MEDTKSLVKSFLQGYYTSKGPRKTEYVKSIHVGSSHTGSSGDGAEIQPLDCRKLKEILLAHPGGLPDGIIQKINEPPTSLCQLLLVTWETSLFHASQAQVSMNTQLASVQTVPCTESVPITLQVDAQLRHMYSTQLRIDPKKQ